MTERPTLVAVLLTLAFVLFPALPVHSQAWTSRGITEPYRDATVSSTVSGSIVAVRAKEGQFVQSGDVIIELDSRLEALEVERRKLIAESIVEVEAARSRLETLRIDLEGTRRLHEQTGSVSEEDLQKKELEYTLAEAELERALVSEKREEIEYQIAKEELQKRFIAAPFDGVIVQIIPELGEGCSPQQPLFRIVDVRTCRLVTHLAQTPGEKLTAGRKIGLRIQTANGIITLQGTVDFVSPVVDPSSSLREVKVLFDNSDGAVSPGVNGTIAAER